VNSPPGRSAHNQYAETANERLFKIAQVSRLDLIWNALHTFVCVPIVALLAYGAERMHWPSSSHPSPRLRLIFEMGSGEGVTAPRTAVFPPCAASAIRPPTMDARSCFSVEGGYVTKIDVS